MYLANIAIAKFFSADTNVSRKLYAEQAGKNSKRLDANMGNMLMGRIL